MQNEQIVIDHTRSDLLVTWEQAVVKFENLVKFAAAEEAQKGRLDPMNSAEDLYQLGMIKLYECWTKWCYGQNKNMEEFGCIFKVSLFRVVKQRTVQPFFVDLEDSLTELPDSQHVDVVGEIFVTQGIQAIKDLLDNEVAVELFEELLSPSVQTLYEVHADIKRKEMVKSQGKRVNIPQDTTVRMKHIIRSLGITTKQYDTAITQIRESAMTILGEDMHLIPAL